MSINRKAIIRILFSLLMFFLLVNASYDVNKIIIGLVIGTFGFYFIYKFAYNYILNQIKKYKNIYIILIVLFCLGISGVLTYSLKLDKSNEYKTADLTITALGDKNKISGGSEVWIEKINVDGTNLNLHEINKNYNWIEKSNCLLSSVGQPNSIQIKNVKYLDAVNIIFLSHAWSGKVKVQIGNNIKQIDLYSSATRDYSLNINTFYHSINIKQFILIMLLIFYLLFFITIFVLEQLIFESNNRNAFKSKVLFFIPSFCVLILYWLSFYPALMSPDSITQWYQMTFFKFDDGSPVFHTLINWIVTRIWHSPAAISLFQIIFFSIIVSISFYNLELLGINKRKLFLVLMIFDCMPINGFMIITLWRDIPYSITIMWLTIILLLLIKDKDWINSTNNTFQLIVALIMVTLIRHNGITVSISSFIFILFLSRKHLRKSFLVGIVVILCIVLIKGPFYKILNVKPIEKWVAVTAPIHQISSIIYSNGDLSVLNSNERKFIETILPYDDWKTSYDKYVVDPIIWKNKNFNRNYVSNNINVLINVWMKLSINNKKIILNHYKNLTSIIWQIDQPKDGYNYIGPLNIESNQFNLVQNSKSIILKSFFSSIRYLTESRKLNWLFWRPALCMYLMLIYIIKCIYKKTYIDMIILTPILSNILGLILTIPGQDVRYLYSNFLVAPIILCLLLEKGVKLNGEKIEM